MKDFIKRLLDFLTSLYRNKKPIETPMPPTPPEQPKPEIPVITPRERLYSVAHALLSPARDVSPRDLAQDDVACVESFSEVYKEAFGVYPDGSKNKPTLSTIAIYDIFTSNPAIFQKTLEVNPGTIIISVTGRGNGAVPHGHIGICGKNDIVMSNNSATGVWDSHLTLQTWVERYAKKGGMKVYLFDRI